MTILLYDNPVSGNCYKVRLLLPAAEIEARRPAGDAALGFMERHLADRDYFVGDRLTIADVALYAYTHVAPEAGFDLAPYPAIRTWLERVAARPGFIPIEACENPAQGRDRDARALCARWPRSGTSSSSGKPAER